MYQFSTPGAAVWLLLILPLYFLPSIIAGTRKNPNTSGIIILNLFLGWTFLGWIGALIWAFSSGAKPTPTVIVNNTPQAHSQEYKVEKPDFSLPKQPYVQQNQSIPQQDKIDQLRQFKQLLDEGIITNEEFDKQKAVILGQ